MALGEQLRNARLRMNLTASQVAAGTRMKVQMVEQLEHEDFDKVAAPIYGKGFIKLYAEYVGLDPKPLIDEYMFRFVDHVSTSEAKSELPKEEDGSGIPSVLKKMDAPDEPEYPAAVDEPMEEESVKPVKIERPKEIVSPASIKTPETEPVVEKAEEPAKKEDFGTPGMPDLFDAVNISKQQESKSLMDEAGIEAGHQCEDIDEEPEQPQASVMDIISDVCVSAVDKCGDLCGIVKDKVSGLLSRQAEPEVKEESERPEKKKTSAKPDFFENPVIMVSSAVVIIAVLIIMALVNKKQSTQVPVEGAATGELELVEEPPQPYVD